MRLDECREKLIYPYLLLWSTSMVMMKRRSRGNCHDMIGRNSSLTPKDDRSRADCQWTGKKPVPGYVTNPEPSAREWSGYWAACLFLFELPLNKRAPLFQGAKTPNTSNLYKNTLCV
jgi:hypothetical protein